MSWESIYKSKLTTANEAVAAIKNNSRLVFGHAAGAPQTIEQALVDNKDNFSNLEVVHMINLGGSGYLQAGMEKHF